LISMSFMALGVSGLALLLLAASSPATFAWRVASGISAAVIAAPLPGRIRVILREPVSGANHSIARVFAVISGGIGLLLLANVLAIHAFWPLGLGVSYHLAASLVSFVGLIRPPADDVRAT